MTGKRTVLFLLLFFVLIGSFLYFVLSDLFFTPRIDVIPSNAYIVPWISQISEVPSDFNIDNVMNNALEINTTFRINVPNGTRIIPSTVYLGHDSNYLYVGGKFVGMGLNPMIQENDSTWLNYFDLFFDATNKGVLTTPESGSATGVFIHKTQTGLLWIYDDMMWVYDPVFTHRWLWEASSEYYAGIHQERPEDSLVTGVKNEYDRTTGTWTMLFARYLYHPANSKMNALQIRQGERWVMGFELQLGFVNPVVLGAPIYSDFTDGWPRNIYPYLSNDSSYWPKIVIDLTNPPARNISTTV